MPALLLYLLKVNVALVLFYLAYHVALRRLTFYHLNRLFLVFGIVFSTVYPFIDLSGLFAAHQPIANAYLVTIPAWAVNQQTIAQTPTFDYWQLPVYLFWAGVIVMFARFILHFVSLYKIHAASEPANYKSIGFRRVTGISQAFSFWQTIYINPASHKTEELESILQHELIHITGWHTLDILLAELSTVLYWFNPGAWLMKKAVKENLEFIADQNVVNTGVDKKEYQYLLLKVVGATQPQIANQFNFPSLKRRIAMMNKMPTRNASKLRLLIALPLAAVLLLAFRSAATKMETITDTEVEAPKQNGDVILPAELVKYLKQNRAIKSVRGKKMNGRDAVVISLKGGSTEVYYLTDAASIAELERKYGLPELPPPPPAPAAPELPAPPPPVQAETTVIVTEQQSSPSSSIFKEDLKEQVLYNPFWNDDLKKNAPEDYKAFMKRNPAINQVSWLLSGLPEYNLISIVLTSKSGETEVYDYKRRSEIQAAEAKYGKLPTLPAPPPPVRAKEQASASAPIVTKVVSEDQSTAKASFPESATYYIDGVEASHEAVRELDPKQIHSINVIKGEAATKVLGSKAATGIISITTLKNKDSEKVIEFNKKTGTLPAPPPPVKSKSSTDKRETSATRPVIRKSYAQIDTLNGTAAQIKRILYARQKAGEPLVDNLILFTKNSKGEGIDVYAKLDGTTIESVKVLATAN